MVKKIVLLVMLSFTLSAMAQPPQRIIIGFHSPLNQESYQTMLANIEEVIQQPAQLIESSNDERWIVELKEAVSKEDMQRFIEKINEIKNVRYVEPDAMYYRQ